MTLNLARKPFRNDRLPGVLLALSAAALLGLTVWQALTVRALLPRRTSSLHQEVELLEKRLERFRAERESMRAPVPDARTLAQWNRVKGIVDQRVFSWTRLFSELEDVMPDGVRVVTITPDVGKNQTLLTVSAIARSPDDGWEFVRVLEDHPSFSNVYPTSEGDDRFEYKMVYTPSAVRQPYTRPSPVAQAAGAAEAQATSDAVAGVVP